MIRKITVNYVTDQADSSVSVELSACGQYERVTRYGRQAKACLEQARTWMETSFALQAPFSLHVQDDQDSCMYPDGYTAGYFPAWQDRLAGSAQGWRKRK